MSKSKRSGKTTSKKPTEIEIPIILEDIASAGAQIQNKEDTPDLLSESISTTTEEAMSPVLAENDAIPQETKMEVPSRTLPPYNVPEKVIIVLDRACDEVFSYFELNNGTKYRPLRMLKNSLLFFLHNKHFIDTKHGYALITLNESSASWVDGFTNDPSKIIDVINSLDECETEDIFDLNSVFDLINENVKLPVVTDGLIIPPPYVVRTVFIYGRSITMPQFEFTEDVRRLLDSPYFTFDVVMTHEIPDSSNKCQLIFKKLQELDTKGYAYFYPVGRNASELHLVMGELTGHPLQRPPQSNSRKTRY